MNLKYKRQGDYLLPNLTIKTNNIDEKINQYGRLRLQFIKANKKAFYTTLLMNNKLQNHLISVSKICDERYKSIMNNFIKNDEKLSEKNKELNQLEWVKLMNNYKNNAEEIIKNEIIFV